MFVHDLADRWHMPVRELLTKLDSSELTTLMAFERSRPPTRAEILHAELMHMIGCLGLKSPKPFDHYLPHREKPENYQELTPAQVRERMGQMLGRVSPARNE